MDAARIRPGDGEGVRLLRRQLEQEQERNLVLLMENMELRGAMDEQERHQPTSWTRTSTEATRGKMGVATLGPLEGKGAKGHVFHALTCKILLQKHTGVYKQHVRVTTRVLALNAGRRLAAGGCCTMDL